MIVLNEQHLQRALSLMSNFFAGLALFLSGLGLYGLLSSSVAQRTSEIGVRMALGAERGRVLHMILSEGLGLLAARTRTRRVGAHRHRTVRGRNALRSVRLRAHQACRYQAVLALVAIVAGLCRRCAPHPSIPF